MSIMKTSYHYLVSAHFLPFLTGTVDSWTFSSNGCRASYRRRRLATLSAATLPGMDIFRQTDGWPHCRLQLRPLRWFCSSQKFAYCSSLSFGALKLRIREECRGTTQPGGPEDSRRMTALAERRCFWKPFLCPLPSPETGGLSAPCRI